jgi:hypothetical protein
MCGRTLAKSFASWPEVLMLGTQGVSFLLLVLWCHCHSHAACRRARVFSHPWLPLDLSQGQ